MAEDYGGWVPKDTESPADREKRMKKEKRAAKLAEMNGGATAGGGGGGGNYQNQNPVGGGEIIDGWQAPAGETPQEREKRQKREKREAYLAQQNGGGGQSGGGNQYQSQSQGGQPRSNENFGGWVPKDSESPADREKRIKKEKRAAYLAAQGQQVSEPSTSSNGNYYPPPMDLSAPPPALAEGGTRAIHPSRLAVNDALARETGDKKGKNAQSMTPARAKYLQKKKLRAKGRKAAAGKGGKNNMGGGDENVSVSASGMGEGEGSVAISSVAGGKRKRDQEDEGSDQETVDGDDKYAGLTAEEKEAKVRKIAELKQMRKEARLAKKAELKRIKAEGGVVPPPKPRTAAPSKLRTSTTVIKAPTPEPETPAEPTEEELAQQKEREEIEARKLAKRQKREQRKLAQEDKKEITTLQDEDAEMSTLIPTGATRERSPTPPTNMSTLAESVEITQPIDSNVDTSIPPASEPLEPTPASPPAALLRLPGATRPAPPSAKTLSTLNIHESVREKQIVDPTKKVKIGDDTNGDGVGLGERGRKRLRGEMGIEEWFAGKFFFSLVYFAS